jgi:hypothetical protein
MMVVPKFPLDVTRVVWLRFDVDYRRLWLWRRLTDSTGHCCPDYSSDNRRADQWSGVATTTIARK